MRYIGGGSSGKSKWEQDQAAEEHPMQRKEISKGWLFRELPSTYYDQSSISKGGKDCPLGGALKKVMAIFYLVQKIGGYYCPINDKGSGMLCSATGRLILHTEKLSQVPYKFGICLQTFMSMKCLVLTLLAHSLAPRCILHKIFLHSFNITEFSRNAVIFINQRKSFFALFGTSPYVIHHITNNEIQFLVFELPVQPLVSVYICDYCGQSDTIYKHIWHLFVSMFYFIKCSSVVVPKHFILYIMFLYIIIRA